nr:unnamed protein product [Spirometra erinaceieuropaei]
MMEANKSQYSRAVKTGTWSGARESEPFDFDFRHAPKRTLIQSTYRQFSTDTQRHFGTSYGAMCKGVLEKMMAAEGKEPSIEVMTPVALSFVTRKLKLHDPKMLTYPRFLETTYRHDYGKFQLPKLERRPPPSHSNGVYESTYTHDYPRKGLPRAGTISDPDLSSVHRKCISQFTDVGDHKRPGWNTWQDESGVYGNTHLLRPEQAAVDHMTDPIHQTRHINMLQ